MRLRGKLRVLRRWQKAGILVLAVLVLYTLLGFLVLPPLFKMILTSQLSAFLGREVSVKSIWVNPYFLSLRISGLEIKEKGSPTPFASFEALYLNLQARSLFQRAVILRQVTLTGPYLQVVRTGPRQFNFSDLLEGEGQAPPIEHFALNNIQILHGKMVFQNLPNQETQVISDLNLSIPFISNLRDEEDIWVMPRFAAEINGSPVAFQGRSRPFTENRKTELQIKVKDINLPRYFIYAPTSLQADLRSGSLDLLITFRFVQHQEPSMLVAGKLQLKDLVAVHEDGSPLLRLPRLEMDIDSLAPLTGKVHLSRVMLTAPELQVLRNRQGVLEVAELMGEGQGGDTSTASSPPSEELAYQLELGLLQVKAATLRFSDHATPEPFQTTLSPLDLEVRDYRSGQAAREVVLSASTKAGERLHLQGGLSEHPLASSGTFRLSGIQMKKYAPYYGSSLGFLETEGNLDLKADYRVRWGEKLQVALSGVAADLRRVGFRSEAPPHDFFRVQTIHVEGGSFDLQNQKLVIGKVRSQKGRLHVVRLRDGRISLLELFAPSANVEQDPPQKATSTPASPEWELNIGQGELQGFVFQLQDLAAPEPVTLQLDQLSAVMRNVSTAPGSRSAVSLNCRVNQQGKLAIQGEMGVSPTFADLKVSLEKVGLPPFQPYLRDLMRVALARGTLSAQGNLLAGTSPNGQPALTYLGGGSLENLGMQYQGEELFSVQALTVSGIDYSNAPAHLYIREAALRGTDAFLRIAPDATLNVLQALQPPQPEYGRSPQPPAEKEGADGDEGGKGASPFGPIKIGKIVLEGGQLDLEDNRFAPAFHTALTDLDGSLVGLASAEGSEAAVELQAKMNGVAPLVMKGKASPLGEVFRLNMHTDLQSMDMTALSPLIQHYVGYPVEKGNLSLNLKYQLVRQKLQSENAVVLDQLSLGEKTESKPVLDLAIKAALPLLKNRQGEIRLSIPVSGDLGDPQFHLSTVILNAVRGVISKALTSPFSILASLIGWHGEKLDYVEFPYGRGSLSKEAQAKLDSLAKALQDRPELNMTVRAHVAVAQDRKALQVERFNRLLQEQKLKDMVRQGQSGLAVEEVRVDPKEYRRYLKAAYREEMLRQGHKRPVIIRPDTTEEVMKDFLLKSIRVTEVDLRALAQKRAVAVRQYLVGQEIDPARVFLETPASLAPEGKKGMRDSRVQLGIR